MKKENFIAFVSGIIVSALLLSAASCSPATSCGQGEKGPDRPGDGKTEFISIESLEFDKDAVDMVPGESYKLSVFALPENHTDTLIFSSNSKCVEVDAEGTVTAKAVGEAVVKVMSGDYSVTAQCTVNVTDDYVDEYGINHGPGIEINGVVWAPVNCGYHKTDYPYGKLYQWGRKDGQGYGDDKGNEDAVLPEILQPLELGDDPEPDCFYINANDPDLTGKQWIVIPEDGDFAFDGSVSWNELSKCDRYDGMERVGNPCPAGWRVPTSAELESLKGGTNVKWEAGVNFTASKDGDGMWFGPNHASATFENPNGCIFFPKNGERDPRTGKAKGRAAMGSYWTSTPVSAFGFVLGGMMFLDHRVSSGGNNWAFALAYGYSVRCVKE